MTSEQIMVLMNDETGATTELAVEPPRWPTPKPTRIIVSGSNGSKVMTLVGNRMYAAKNVQGCFTCTSTNRFQIEDALLKGVSYKKIADAMPPDPALPHPLTARNIKSHYLNGHMPIDEEMRRAIIEIRAKEMGYDIDNFASSLADYITLARLVIQTVLTQMINGELTPDLKDAVAFAKILQQYEVQAGEGVDQEVVYQAFLVFEQVIRKHTTPDQFQAIGVSLATNPVLRALKERQVENQEMMAEEEQEMLPV